jgi:head-tail adaptor
MKWLKATRLPNTLGQPEESFALNGYLWCQVESNQGRKQEDYGAERTGITATIRIRNYPEITALDRLESVEWGDLWVIESIGRGDNELIADCYLFDEDLEGIA